MDQYSLECCEEYLAINMEKQRQPVKGKTKRDGKGGGGRETEEMKGKKNRVTEGDSQRQRYNRAGRAGSETETERD